MNNNYFFAGAQLFCLYLYLHVSNTRTICRQKIQIWFLLILLHLILLYSVYEVRSRNSRIQLQRLHNGSLKFFTPLTNTITDSVTMVTVCVVISGHACARVAIYKICTNTVYTWIWGTFIDVWKKKLEFIDLDYS